MLIAINAMKEIRDTVMRIMEWRVPDTGQCSLAAMVRKDSLNLKDEKECGLTEGERFPTQEYSLCKTLRILEPERSLETSKEGVC